MTHSTRRGALGTILSATGGLALLHLPAHASNPITIPAGPMRLGRRIERSLSGGAAIIVERAWDVTFARARAGVAITGSQIHAEVDAPERLAALAAIEQARSTDGIWPITLSAQGRILAAGKPIADADLAAALDAAEEMIDTLPIPASERGAHTRAIAELQRVGTSLLDTLPADLFYPSLGPVRSMREIEVGAGMRGEFEVSYEAVADAAGGWLSRAERHVVTRLGASESRASETWTLGQAVR